VASVDLRSVANRLRHLLHHMPVPSSADPEPPSALLEGECEGEHALVVPAEAPRASATDEAFVVSLYPPGVDKERGAALAMAAGREPPAAKKTASAAMEALMATRAKERDAKAEERRALMEAKAELRAKEREAKIEAVKEQRAALAEAREKERIAIAEKRVREGVMGCIKAMITKLEQQAVRESKTSAAGSKRVRESDKTRDREEEKRKRHMNKMSALEGRVVVVHADLKVHPRQSATAATTAGSPASSGGLLHHLPDGTTIGGSSSSGGGSSSGGAVVSLGLRLLPDSSGMSVPPVALSSGFQRLLSEYDHMSEVEKFSKTHRWVQLLEGIEFGLQLALGSSVVVRSSMGCGKWARVPWITVHDPNQTTQSGLFLQYLVQADVKGAYLCLAQGTSKLRSTVGPPAANMHVANIGAFVRERCRMALGQHAALFDLYGRVELRAPKGHGAPFEKGAIISRHYPAGHIPDEASMMSHLRLLLHAYNAVINDPQYVKFSVNLAEQTAAAQTASVAQTAAAAQSAAAAQILAAQQAASHPHPHHPGAIGTPLLPPGVTNVPAAHHHPPTHHSSPGSTALAAATANATAAAAAAAAAAASATANANAAAAAASSAMTSVPPSLTAAPPAFSQHAVQHAVQHAAQQHAHAAQHAAQHAASQIFGQRPAPPTGASRAPLHAASPFLPPSSVRPPLSAPMPSAPRPSSVLPPLATEGNKPSVAASAFTPRLQTIAIPFASAPGAASGAAPAAPTLSSAVSGPGAPLVGPFTSAGPFSASSAVPTPIATATVTAAAATSAPTTTAPIAAVPAPTVAAPAPNGGTW